MTDLDIAPYRTLRVRGFVSEDAIIEVHVNGVLCKNGPVTNDNLFEFQTLVTFHGTVPISITVLEGKITLGDTIVTYPALINRNVPGYFSFPIPLENMLAEVTDTTVSQYKDYSITLCKGDTFNCSHLLVNGPSQWLIGVNYEVHHSMIVYTSNVDHPSSTINFLSPEFHYRPFDPNHCNNRSLDKLIQQLTNPLYVGERIEVTMPSWV